MDYWKNVPGINDHKSIVVSEKAGDAKSYLKRDVIKQMISSGKWEVSHGDVNGKSGSSLTMKQMGKKGGKSRNVIIESAIDSGYLQHSLDMLAKDFRRGEKEERAIVPILRHIESRLNQSFPDGDVSEADIEDLLKEVAARSAIKKSKMSISDIISMIMDF
jgi:hypothetical protein